MLDCNVLCISNRRSGSRYAWDFIRGLFRDIAARNPGETWVAFPKIDDPPQALVGSRAKIVELAWRPGSLRQTLSLARFVRRNRIRSLYLHDLATWHLSYAFLRLAGIRRIVVHDHTFGGRIRPRGMVRVAKQIVARLPSGANVVIGVSDEVARRLIEVNMVPSSRVYRIWNTLDNEIPTHPADIHAEFGIAPERPVIVCSCRATKQKGVEVLLRAFDRLERSPAPVLVYFGDGPDMDAIRVVRAGLRHGESVILAGYRADARSLVAAAQISVSPSISDEGLGLAALEPMAAGVVTVVSDVGGLAEVVGSDAGIRVPAQDVDSLASALDKLLSDANERLRISHRGKQRARELFSRTKAMDDLAALVVPPLANGTESVRMGSDSQRT